MKPLFLIGFGVLCILGCSVKDAVSVPSQSCSKIARADTLLSAFDNPWLDTMQDSFIDTTNIADSLKKNYSDLCRVFADSANCVTRISCTSVQEKDSTIVHCLFSLVDSVSDSTLGSFSMKRMKSSHWASDSGYLGYRYHWSSAHYLDTIIQYKASGLGQEAGVASVLFLTVNVWSDLSVTQYVYNNGNEYSLNNKAVYFKSGKVFRDWCAE